MRRSISVIITANGNAEEIKELIEGEVSLKGLVCLYAGRRGCLVSPLLYLGTYLPTYLGP